MARSIFKNQTTNTVSATYRLLGTGFLFVYIGGTLDGADVTTEYDALTGDKGIAEVLSWQVSKGDSLTGVDGGYEMFAPSLITFKVANAGGSTDISLSTQAQAKIELVE